MKCCICKEKEFAVMLELHLPPSKLPNQVCDDCMLTIMKQSDSLDMVDKIYDAVQNKVSTYKGSRCK